jgi:hypothetical protein|tara:strand:- start:323 stop:667 length:345 start_codon:yes stop_codon:yes gene_type:complete
MANVYKNNINVVATTNIQTLYTCPAETVALVKSVSAYNAHASATADWTLTLYDSSATANVVYAKAASTAAAGKVEFLEGDSSTVIVLEESDAIKFTTTVTSANVSISVLQQDRT